MLPDSCPPAQSIRVVNRSPLQVAGVTDAPGYGSRLATTPWGPASLPHWCVWIEPPDSEPPDRWEQRWSQAVNAALDRWSRFFQSTGGVSGAGSSAALSPQTTLRPVAQGWRASNGRSRLQVIEVRRQQVWRLNRRWRCWCHRISGLRCCRPLLCMSWAMPSASGGTAPTRSMRWLCIRGGSLCSGSVSVISRPCVGCVISPMATALRLCTVPLDPASCRQLPQDRDRSPLFGCGHAVDPAGCLCGTGASSS